MPMTMSTPATVGGLEDPATTDAYKRAVYRPPPPGFAVEMLGAAKQGSGYSYGMRIHPLCSADRHSISSHRSHTEYDIWRRWEDCLLFQNTLEIEYRQRARVKRQRLLQGKGVKRNGFYLQDQASSWESLPPGPAPNSVAREIHEYLPILTKKNTVFRASQATVDQRAAELKALIEAFFRPDVPSLIDELRSERIVLDFFGYWRRDFELAEKEKKHRRTNSKQRVSISPSIFSMYFSSAKVDVADADSMKSQTNSPSRRPPAHIITTISRSTDTRRYSSDSSEGSVISGRTRAYSTSSSTYSPSTPSDSGLDSPSRCSMTVPDGFDDVQTPYGIQDSHLRLAPHAADHSRLVLGTPPEDEVPSSKDSSLVTMSPSRRKSRNGVIFLAPPPLPTMDSTLEDLLPVPRRDLRQSWQTVDSAALMLEGMHLEMPSSPTETSHRLSVSSIATFQTNCSAEGVLPRSPFTDASPSPRQRQVAPGGRPRASRVVSCPISISEIEEEWSDSENDILEEFFESFPAPSFDVPQDIAVYESPETPALFQEDLQTPLLPAFPSTAKSDNSPLTNIPKSCAPRQLIIKAACHDTFIVLRVPPEISYKDLRNRLYNKFVGVEGVPLSEKFTISFVQPLTFDNTLDHSSTHDSEHTALYPVHSEGDWECVAASLEGEKLTLRICDATA